MKTKRNISLIIGLAIPLVMIVLVAASIYLPGLFAPSPRFNFLYVLGDDYYQGQQYVVEKGKLIKREVKYPEHYTPYYPYTPGVARLFVHDVVRNESREISFEDAQQLSLNANIKSPDGFEVVYGSSGDGIFPLFFFHDTDYSTVYIKGHNASRKLNLQAGTTGGYYYYYNRFRFLGWIR